jgi:hypothetical protein
MLWELKPDCRNELVSDAIRRREMDAVLQCLHFRDNAQIDSDGYYKVCLWYSTVTYISSPKNEPHRFKMSLSAEYYFLGEAHLREPEQEFQQVVHGV